MKQYIVDAFTDKLFAGNQAAVCILDEQIDDGLMRNIAKENNFSETAFCIKRQDDFLLRWFTPKDEIDLCGHATLATAYVIKKFLQPNCDFIRFQTLSGRINVRICENDLFEMEFPSYRLNQVEITDIMANALGTRPIEAYLDRDLLLILDSEEAVSNLKPDFKLMKELSGLAVAVSAKAKDYDCISRVFAPELAIAEDPVTGSTHCMIAPYWAKKYGKNHIKAFQSSERTGELFCEVCDGCNKVKISGKAVLFGISDILI